MPSTLSTVRDPLDTGSHGGVIGGAGNIFSGGWNGGHSVGSTFLSGGWSGNSSPGLQWAMNPLAAFRRKQIASDYNPNDDVAQRTFADLTRGEWADYMQRFVPRENLLIQYATSPQTVVQNAEAARAQVQAAYAQQPDMVEREFKGLGVTPTAAQQQSIDKQRGLSAALAESQAVNQARTYTRDTQMAALSGGVARQGVAAALQPQNQK